jgi:hypothetical protein
MTYNEARVTTVDRVGESELLKLFDGAQRSRASAALGFSMILCLHLSCDEAGVRGLSQVIFAMCSRQPREVAEGGASGQNHRRVYAVRAGKCGASADAGADLGIPWVSQVIDMPA